MMRQITFIFLLTLIFVGCGVKQKSSASEPIQAPVAIEPVKPSTPNQITPSQPAPIQPMRSKSALLAPKSTNIEPSKVSEPIDLANPPKGSEKNSTVPKKKKSN